jgi:catechol 2,3-dioxygenase-like lactoylglutathione lyase family enzyme
VANTIEHVGIVVDSLAKAKAFLGNVMGFQLDRESDLPNRGTKAAFFRAGSVQVEAIECTDPKLRGQRLGPDGTQARLEHIAIIVEDLANHLVELRKHGVKTVPSEPPYIVTPGRKWVMTEPETSMGVMYQILQLDG